MLGRPSTPVFLKLYYSIFCFGYFNFWKIKNLWNFPNPECLFNLFLFFAQSVETTIRKSKLCVGCWGFIRCYSTIDIKGQWKITKGMLVILILPNQWPFCQNLSILRLNEDNWRLCGPVFVVIKFMKRCPWGVLKKQKDCFSSKESPFFYMNFVVLISKSQILCPRFLSKKLAWQLRCKFIQMMA